MLGAVQRARAAAAAGRGSPAAAAAAQPLPPVVQAGVQVTAERVVAPPERFIAVPDDSLLQHFQHALGGGEDDAAGSFDALPQLLSMVDGLSSHKFLSLRRRLEGDFSIFSGACSGGGAAGGGGAAAAAGARRPLKRLSSIEAHGERPL